MVRGQLAKSLVIDTLLPDQPGRFSWGGHLGKQMQHPVVEEIAKAQTTLVFVNMRSQAEAWYQLLLEELGGGLLAAAAPRTPQAQNCRQQTGEAGR